MNETAATATESTTSSRPAAKTADKSLVETSGFDPTAGREVTCGYLLATNVPDYWIPFQPQRIDPTKPDMQRRRGARPVIVRYGADVVGCRAGAVPFP